MRVSTEEGRRLVTAYAERASDSPFGLTGAAVGQPFKHAAQRCGQLPRLGVQARQRLGASFTACRP